MAAQGHQNGWNVLILFANDADEWSEYLNGLLSSSGCFSVSTYLLKEDTSLSRQDYHDFERSKCILILLSEQLQEVMPNVQSALQSMLQPAHKVVVLLCGVTDSEELRTLFSDSDQWRCISCEDEPDVYITAVKEAINEGYSKDSGCDTAADTEPELDPHHKTRTNVTERSREHCLASSGETEEFTVKVLPDRIQCGVATQIFIVMKIKLDYEVKSELEFTLKNQPSVRIPAVLINEYTMAAQAPDLPPGSVSLSIYSGNLKVSFATITYYTDMEEIQNILQKATNPVEFMCQAFHIIPYNTEKLDKLLTESLRKNIPANGLHVFGISQLEEENMSAAQRDEELPTLLHFAAKYGLKNLTALLLQCPGALQAYSVANRNGDYPNSLAERSGYRDLRQFIDEYVETADLLKTHIEEELWGNTQSAEDEDLYESMATANRLMKCSLNPGCDEDIYESMIGMLPSAGVTESTYESMHKLSGGKQPSLHQPDCFVPTSTDTILRKFLEGNIHEACEDPYKMGSHDHYDTGMKTSYPQEIVNRPPATIPRPSLPSDMMEPYISKVFSSKEERRSENIYVTKLPSTPAAQAKQGPVTLPKREMLKAVSSDYDPFAGMMTPGQRQLITLQEQVKLQMISVDEALVQFKEWQLHQKRRSDSFRFQQENLKKLRDSITRRQKEKGKSGVLGELQISLPTGQSNMQQGLECGVYEANARMIPLSPARVPIQRRNWTTASTSSTTSSASSRSSTRSTWSSGAEADNEDNEQTDSGGLRRSLNRDRPPTLPPPRVPPRIPARSSPQTEKPRFAPPVPPRGR
uniref:Phosphoinositide 3-kinase adapter protein 1 n=1 Tax=Callorhinchus milii TaxID=7868 RepID=V9KCB5_CALMI